MAQYVCDRCGAVNPVGADFCVSCHAFLAWDEIEEDTTTKPDETVRSGEPASSSEQNEDTKVVPQIRVPARPAEAETDDRSTSWHDGPADSTEALFRTIAKQREITVPATGEPAGLVVQITNTSTIVDGYVVEAPNAPDWLALEAGQVRLLPGTEEAVPVKMRVVSATLVPAQHLQLVLRIRSISQAPVQLDLPVLLTVPVLDVPVRLHAEPSLLRVRDSETAECTLVVDNSSSNRPVKLRVSGTDPELAVRFRFEPPVLEVGPAASASLEVAVAAARPGPGEEISRQLTVTAFDGTRRVETLITFQQSTSARVEDPMVTLEVEPSLVRVRDSTVGLARVVADNRAGREWAQVQLKGTDPERLVRLTWASRELRVPPGGTAETEARFEAPLPEAGTEVIRTVTLSATDGRRTSTTTATFVQSTSASPMTTLALRIEPSMIRLNDADAATVQVTVDNRRGRFGVRVFLDGSDPERAIRFTFSPRVVDVSPGQLGTVQVRLDSGRPRPGQGWTRQFTVTASDGNSSVDASGSLVQTSSRAATWRTLRKMVVAVIAGAVIAGGVIVGGAILMGDGLEETPPPTIPPSPDSRPVGTATITLSPKSGPAGTRISVSGEAFRPSEEVEIKFHVWGCGSATADDLGAFTGATCTVPSDIKPGTFIVVGRGRTSGEWDEADFKLT